MVPQLSALTVCLMSATPPPAPRATAVAGNLGSIQGECRRRGTYPRPPGSDPGLTDDSSVTSDGSSPPLCLMWRVYIYIYIRWQVKPHTHTHIHSYVRTVGL